MVKRIFVFGSNLAGIHGAGAARHAFEKHGALWGQGYGPSGHSFAIPSKDEHIRTMPLDSIRTYVDGFIEYASFFHQKEFQVTRIGCGLAGLRDVDMAFMFNNAPPNCFFDEAWKPFLHVDHKYWGTF